MPEIPKLSKKKVAVAILAILLIISAFYGLFGQNFEKMAVAMARADFEFILLAFLGQLIFILFWAKRWDVSLTAMGSVKNSIKDLYLILFGSKFVNNVTPFSYSGGDPVTRAYLLKKLKGTPYSMGAASSIAEYFPDFSVFVGFLLFGLFTSFKEFSMKMTGLVIGLTVILVSILFFAVYSILGDREIGRIERFLSWVSEKFKRPLSKERIKEEVDQFSDALEAVLKQKKIFAEILFLSLLVWMANFGIMYSLFMAFQITPPIPMILLGMTLPLLVGMIPITLGGLGTMDATRYGIFYIFLSGHPLIIANVVILRRLIGFVFMTIAGGTSLSYLGIRVWQKD